MTKKSTSTASDSGPDPFTVALRLLTRCDRSSAQLRQKLEERGFAEEAITDTITRCRKYNYLDDERYATERARALMRAGKGVGSRVLYDLRRKGIDEETARQALLTAEEEFSTTDLLAHELARRYPDFNYDNATAKERCRVVNFFLRRGFALQQVMQQLKKHPDI